LRAPRLLLLCAVALLLPLRTGAQEFPMEDLMNPGAVRARDWLRLRGAQGSVWRGDIELGYIGATGNANTISAHSRLRLQNDRPRWTHTFRYEIVFAEEESVTTTDLTRASQKSAYKLTADDYLFETVRYDRNPDSGYRYRFSEVLGYGRRVVRSETVKVFLEAGPGARQTRQPDDALDGEAQVYISGELEWDISANANLNQLVVVEAAESNTVTDSLTALTARIDAAFSMKLSHSIVHNSTPGVDAAPTDSVTSVTLVYTF
jgi:putative salt-induced outer membrane protein